MPIRCLIVSYYFPPVGGGGVQRVTKLIKYLSKMGWEFTVITSNPDTIANIPHDSSLLEEIPQSTKVIRVSNPLTSNQNFLFRKILKAFKSTFLVRWINSLFFIPDMHKKWTLMLEDKINSINDKENFDLVFISSPPYSLACLASVLKQRLDIPVLLDMRDPWTTNPYKIYPTRWHLKKEKKLERLTISNIQYGISSYNTLIEYYVNSGYKGSWIHIPNGFDETDFYDLKKISHNKDLLNIAFSGTFYSHLNNPKLLFKAISKLPLSQKEKISFHHIGDSNISVKKIAAKYGIGNNIVEWGYKGHKQCLEILAGMDVLCFILDSSNPNAQYTIGGKVYEYLKLAKPILALVPENGEAARLINETASGVVVDPQNEQAIIKILSSWVSIRPNITPSKIIDKYERSHLAQQYHSYFQKILLEM